MGALKKGGVLGPMFNSISIRKGLVVSLISIFWGHDGAYESDHILEQKKRMMMITTLASICNNTTKVKRPREGGFSINYFWVLFCGGSFIFLYISVKPKKILNV